MLSRLIGATKAKKLIFFAEKLSATEAFNLGLIDYLVENNAEMNELLEKLINKLKKNGPIAIRAAKRAINKGLDEDLQNGLITEGSCYDQVLLTQDWNEGIRSFLEKREPVYQNK